MPLNVMDAHYDSFQKQVLPVLVNTDRPAGDEIHGRPSLLDSKTVTPMECLHYA